MPLPILPPVVRAAPSGPRARSLLGGRRLLLVIVSVAVAITMPGCDGEPAQRPTDPGPAATAREPGESDASTEPDAELSADPDAAAPPYADADASPDGLGALPPLHPAIDGLDETVVTLATPTGAVEVRAKVAATGEDRARGLMEVTDLPDGAGMLFLFDQDRTGGFWMWNTVLPLDIAFAGADGVVHTIETMTPCEEERSTECPVTSPAEPYRAALEVPAGWFERAGVGTGAVMTWTDPVPDAD